MAENLVQVLEPQSRSDGVLKCKLDLSKGSSSSTLFQRRIKFHPARKPFKGFRNGGGDFRMETLNPSSSDSTLLGSVKVGKKSDGSEILENGLDPELSFEITFRRIGAGLENLGNTCFLNSVLQCLTYTEPLAAYLQSGKHQNSCHIAGFCALCAIQKHVSRALQSTGRSLAPKDLVSNLRCISRNFRNCRQEDAHEYMVNLLESMHKCCLPSGVPSESPSAYEKSLVHKIFGGSLRSQVKCLQCSFRSNKFDPFLDLSLEIVKADSLHKALVNFTAAEHLDGGERQYQCQQCKQKVRALKRLTVHKPPNVLTIHLKRFRAHDPGQKIDKKVSFGPTLDLKSFVSGSYEGDLKYTLYGVLVHHGWSTHSGHYYSYVRTSSGMWYSLDDSRVVQVSEKTVLEQKAYMLFYVRDRKTIIPRKPVDLSQKENAKTNENRAKNYMNSNQVLTKPIQNGSTVVGLNGVTSSASVTQKDALNVGPQKISPLNEMLDQPKLELSQTKALVKEPMERVPLLPKISEQCLKTDQPSDNGDACKIETSTSTVATHTNGLKEEESLNKKSTVSVVTSPIVEEIQSSTPTTDQITNKISQEQIPTLHVEESRVALLKAPTGLQDQPNREKSSVENITNCNGAENLLDKKACNSGPDSVLDESVKASGTSTVTKGSLHGEASDCKSQKKLKKKLLRRQVASMSFRSSMFLRASLAVRKKKKHKKSKLMPLDSKNGSKEVLSNSDCFPSDLGPSTSEKTPTSPRKQDNSGARKEANRTPTTENENTCGDSLKTAVDGYLPERNGQNGSVLATDEQLQKNQISRETVSSHSQDSEREKMQNGWMDVLTHGLSETVVARWDGIELPPQAVESVAANNVSIGYVADEWDEEYDRGKRKKVRLSQHEFGGENPFQKIASKKTNFKKVKMDRFRSGNQPLRI
ncbi:ubiquitin carboxyl-terminal hydrolase 23 isoform X1 [Cannabis sativa]|uniref:ubiquitin carboxyl-terminal hydrolase 23 isoform X1 n=1 Tax=Cannabis sativa TaxID=3483 RepID=UPI0011E04644|nr:ubiquitin carboxyl-terminal hydrolase 23 isoform X1 [Cannabis sativa]